MASPKVMATMNEHLPEDIIVQILYRLPVKPLIRFGCVSKRWSSIVSDPQFAKSQFKFASERKTLSHRILLSNSSQLESLDLQTLSFEDDASFRKLTCPFKQPGRAVMILGSCNGLPHCGFGYVSATDDYKVVVAGRFKNSTVPVEMYSSKANSWKRIESQPNFSAEEYFTDSRGTFSNEALHWLDPADKPTIIAFDLVKEKFREMPLPLLKQDDETNAFCSEMGVVSGGCLCVASYTDVLFCWHIQLWVMMDYDVCESWTKLVKLVDELLRPPFVCRETSIVMLSYNGEEEIEELVRFDYKEEEKLDKAAVCSGRYWFEGDMIEYDESLLWLHDYQGAQNPTQAQKKKKK